MSLSKFAARRRGFTLIELLIVIVVIAILALIVIPRLMGASRKAKDSTLKANLQMLRNSIEQYQADMGDYPPDATWSTALTTAPTDATAVNWKGPYLSASGGIGGGPIPMNPYSNGSTADQHWNYTYSATAATIEPLDTTLPSTNDASGTPYANY